MQYGWQVWQKKQKPTMNNFQCLVFVGNHGIAKRNVSAYPSEVTEQMVKNFKNGGAAINQLCDLSNIALSVIPINLDKPTKDFSEEKAMNLSETLSAMQLGYNSVPKKCDLLILQKWAYQIPHQQQLSLVLFLTLL